MNATITIMAILAMIAAVGAVTTLTSMSFVQEAEASACVVNEKTLSTTGTCKKIPHQGPDADNNFHHHFD